MGSWILVTETGEAFRPKTRKAPRLPKQVAQALLDDASGLSNIGRKAEAIEIYDELVARFGTSTDPGLRVLVGNAMLAKASLLCDGEHAVVFDETLNGLIGPNFRAIQAYDEVVTRFGMASDLTSRVFVASALLSKGIVLGGSKAAAGAYDDLLARFGGASEPILRELVAQALLNKGATLGDVGRRDDAIAVYDDLVARFGKASEPSLRDLVGMALVNKGGVLSDLGRYREVVAALRRARKFVISTELRQSLPAHIKKYLTKAKEYNDGISERNNHNKKMDGGYTIEIDPLGAGPFRHELKPLPEGLSWPRHDFPKETQYYNKPGGRDRYIKEVWGPLSQYIDMPTLRERWPRAAEAIDRARPKLSPEILPPIKRELTDRVAAAVLDAGARPWRVEHALRMRASRARKKASIDL
jgi:tetratricopeptide (TPR) repeat protein